jgi:hypothetical protein
VSGSEAPASAHKRRAPALPARVAGLHKKAQKQAKNSHHGTFTALSSSSAPATGRNTIDAASKLRRSGEATCPLAIWNTRQEMAAKLAAPTSAMTQDASRGAKAVASAATRRG